MSQVYDVVVLVGSPRKKSFNRLLAKSLEQLAPPVLSLRIVEIGDLPFYNDELEADAPAGWQRVRRDVAAADAVLFVTPEYNRSVPAVLKNAVDVLSRPFGKGALTGKPAAVISSTPGALGGFGANHHLRQSLVCVGVNTMSTPEVYLGGITSAFDEQGALVSPAVKEILTKFITAFEQWVRLTSKV